MQKRRSLRANERFAVLTRDGFKCRYCGAKPPDVSLVVDHIIPVAKGGVDHWTNYVTACVRCNIGKSKRELPKSLFPSAKRLKFVKNSMISASKHIRIYKSTYILLHDEAKARRVSIAWLLKEKLQ